jgi:hypothetical protein
VAGSRIVWKSKNDSYLPFPVLFIFWTLKYCLRRHRFPTSRGRRAGAGGGCSRRRGRFAATIFCFDVSALQVIEALKTNSAQRENKTSEAETFRCTLSSAGPGAVCRT